MARTSIGLIALFSLALTTAAHAYTQADLQTSGGTIETIPLEATVVVSPPSINIKTYGAGTFTIYRKAENATTWGTAKATGIGLAAEGVWSDTTAVVGTLYEYKFVNTAGTSFNGIQPTGYILAGIQVDKALPKGRVAVVVASDVPATLPAEYAQYKSDLVRDGWAVHEIQCFRAADYASTGVAAIKTITITSGGTGYTTDAPVLLTAGSKKARGVTVASGGVISAVTLSSGGAGFAVGDALTLTGGGGSGFAATVASVDITHSSRTVSVSGGGSGYTDNDQVTITGGASGATASGYIIAKAGPITAVLAVLSSAFTTGESLTITPSSGGSGVAAKVSAIKGAHVSIRENIQSIYISYSGELKNVVLLGRVPVCRSGIDDDWGIDGHGIVTAYPTDAFYAEMTSAIGTGGWTDTANNADRLMVMSPDAMGYLAGEQSNMEGDGKYDANKIFEVGGSGAVELGFGRIDFFTESVMEMDALRNYFGKLHRYKTASPDFLPGRKACIRGGSFPNVTETGLQSMPNVGGMSNLEFVPGTARPTVAAGEDADQAYSALHGPYLFYFKEGTEPMAGEGGKAVFWTGYQSHWGYWWDSGVMQRNLAEDSFTLSYTWDAWGTRFIYHRMGMGFDAGDMMKVSQNNNGFVAGSTYSYKFNNAYNYDHNGQLWMEHIGDPTLRLFMFEPASQLSIVKSGSNPALSWVASPEPGVVGYHVYRKPRGNGSYTRLTATPQAGITYTDSTATSGSYTYMVSAVKLETTGGGTFYNPSLGVEQSVDLTNAPVAVSVVTASLPDASWNTAYSQTLEAQGGWPLYSWTVTSGALPAGLSLSSSGAITGAPTVSGSFAFTVQATDKNSQTASKALSLTVGNNELDVVYPEATTYVTKNSPTSNYGTSELNYMTYNSGQPWEIFHRYDLSGLDVNNGFVKATLRIYLTPGTPTAPTVDPSYALVQGQLMADSGDGWSEAGIGVWFSAYSNNGAGKVRIASAGHGLVNGSMVTIAGLTGTGAPTAGPYSVTLVDADHYDLATVSYVAGWSYDPAFSYATTTNITWNNRPTAINANTPVVSATSTPVVGTFLEMDVTSLVAETLASDSQKLMTLRLFTGASQKLGFESRRGYAGTKPRLVIESSNAPQISLASPAANSASVYFGESLAITATAAAIPARAGSLVVAWTKVSGPGTVTFATPSAASTAVSFGAAGDYVIRLTASDGVLQSTKDLTVRVLSSAVFGTTANMTLRLPFDEASGTAAADVSGSGNNGTLSSNATWTTAGRIGGALDCTGGSISKSISGYSDNGSGKVRIACVGHGLQTGMQVTIAGFSSSAINGVRQITVVNSDTFDTTVAYVAGWTLTSPTATYATSYVKVAHSSTLDNAQKLTVSAWVKPTAVDGTIRSVVSKTLANTGGAYGMRIQNGVVTGLVSTSSITGSRVLAAGQWAHLVLVFDGALGAENTKLYIDGSPDTFDQLTEAAIPLKNTAPLWIGAVNDASPSGFIGAIDEVRVYQGKALTQSEIVDLYQGAPSNMGPQVSVTAPVSPVADADCAISGTVTDDGLPLVTTLAWSQVSGPAAAVFANSASASTTVNFPVAGTYVLRLTADDGSIASYAELTAAVAANTQPPAITSQPSSCSIIYNAIASLSVTASGAGRTYQWYQGASGITTTPVSGAISAEYTTPALTATTSYWVRVSGTNGAPVDSNTATVTVGVQPTAITTQPASTSVSYNGSTTLSVVAISTGLSYQWYQGASPSTASPVGGATASSFTTPSLTSTTTYWVKVTNAGGTADSSSATVTVLAPSMAVTRSGAVADEGSDAIAATLVTGAGSPTSYTITNSGTASLTVANATIGAMTNCNVTVNTQPAGTVASGGGSTALALTVTPTANGPFSFTVSMATNDLPSRNPYNWTVSGTAFLNTPPVIAQAGPLAVTMSEDGSPTAWSAPTVTASDADGGQTLTWSVKSGAAASHGTATVSGTGSSPSVFTYAPTLDYFGSDSFTVQVSDGTATAEIVVNVTIQAANDYTVTNLNDSGAGSLRQAMTDANASTGNKKIGFSVTGTITLLSDLPAITKTMTIDGAGQVVVIDGGASQLYRPFACSNLPAVNLTLKDLTLNRCGRTETAAAAQGGAISWYRGGILTLLRVTIQNGLLKSASASATAYTASGGGIYVSQNVASVVNLTDVTIQDCVAQVVKGTSTTGGVAYGGGLYMTGPITATLTRCKIATNSTVTDSTAGDFSYGGGISLNTPSAPLTLIDCTISGNAAQYGGGISYFGASGAADNAALLTIMGSTIDGNMAKRLAGSGAANSKAWGGGIYATAATSKFGNLMIYATTVAGNTASTDSTGTALGGGIYTQIATTVGTMTTAIYNSTISANGATSATAASGYGGGIYLGTIATNTLSIVSSIVQGNTMSATGSPTFGADITKGAPATMTGTYSLIGSTNGAHGMVNGVNNCLIGTASLNALASNGGLTKTMSLQAGSLAIGAGSMAAAASAGFDTAADQRGSGYLRDVSPSLPDIGAFEDQSAATAITVQPAGSSIAHNATASLSVTATGASLTYQWYQGASGITTSLISGATSAGYTTPALTSSASYWVRVTGANGSVDSSAATVTVATAFDSWAPTGITDPAKRGPADDADGDSIVNLLEFALGLDPNVSNASGLPSAAINGANLDFTFWRASADLTYTVEVSTTLAGGGWTTVATNPGSVGTDVTVSVPMGADTKIFVRLRVAE